MNTQTYGHTLTWTQTHMDTHTHTHTHTDTDTDTDKQTDTVDKLLRLSLYLLAEGRIHNNCPCRCGGHSLRHLIAYEGRDNTDTEK